MHANAWQKSGLVKMFKKEKVIDTKRISLKKEREGKSIHGKDICDFKIRFSEIKNMCILPSKFHHLLLFIIIIINYGLLLNKYNIYYFYLIRAGIENKTNTKHWNTFLYVPVIVLFNVFMPIYFLFLVRILQCTENTLY